jgi:hypothetical protein
VFVYCGTQEKLGRFKQGIGNMLRQHWLDYDFMALAVLLGGLGFLELLVLSIPKFRGLLSPATRRDAFSVARAVRRVRLR